MLCGGGPQLMLKQEGLVASPVDLRSCTQVASAPAVSQMWGPLVSGVRTNAL